MHDTARHNDVPQTKVSINTEIDETKVFKNANKPLFLFPNQASDTTTAVIAHRLTIATVPQT